MKTEQYIEALTLLDGLTRHQLMSEIVADLRRVSEKCQFSEEVAGLFRNEENVLQSDKYEGIANLFTMDVSKEIIDYLLALSDRSLLRVFAPENQEQFWDALDDRFKRLEEVVVASAVSITSELKEELAQLILKKRPNLRLVHRTDPNLIAGCVLIGENETRDYSLATHGIAHIHEYLHL